MKIDDAPPAVAVDSASAAPPPQPRRRLLSGSLARPGHLLWVGALPQALLLFLNWRAFTLAAGEMNAEQRAAALRLGSGGLGLLLLCLAVPLVWRLAARGESAQLALGWCWPLLLLPVGYLTLAFTGLETMVPATVADWILPRGELLYNQFVLTMPLVFYAGLRLACFETRASAGLDFVICVAAILLPVGGSYALFRIGSPGASMIYG